MDNKKISIIMGVYNCQDTIEEAINSILRQSYKNWELIVCDDCSTDGTYSILENYKNEYPDKFIIIRNKKNCKLAYSLNECLKHVNGYYVARMDGDDRSSSDRLEKQVNFLQENNSIDLVGTAMQRFDENGLADMVYPPDKPNRFTMRNRIPFNHATIMTKKSVYDKLGGYTVKKRTMRAQDHDLWFRFFYHDFVGENLMEPLYFVRENVAAIKRRTFDVRFNAYKTTLYGYRLLKFPWYWYIRPTYMLILKAITPYSIISRIRSIEKKTFISTQNTKKK